jgi:hypothetical protein
MTTVVRLRRSSFVMQPIRFLLACCALALGGCSDPYGPYLGPEPSVEAEFCVADDEDLPPTSTREVSVGLGDGEVFAAFEPGQEISLVQGGQGGYMIVPSVRVPVAEGDGEQACWNVRIDNEISSEGTEVPDLLSRVEFDRRGDHLQVDGLYDLLGYNSDALEGQTLTMTVTVTGRDFEGVTSVELLLR